MEETEERCTNILAIISNIPVSYHSCDLRNYFLQFIERSGFKCFHFKNRSESREAKPDGNDRVARLLVPNNYSAVESVDNNSQNSGFNQTEQTHHGDERNRTDTKCCIVKLDSTEKLKEFQRLYHKRHWLDRNGERIKALCSIKKIAHSEDNHSTKYQTRGEQKAASKNREEFSSKDLENLPELHPPTNIMPNGNVGTPTAVFLSLIQQCKFPPSVIKKLGITFPKIKSRRRYSNVPFEYTNSTKFTIHKFSESKIGRNSLLQERSNRKYGKERTMQDNQTNDQNSDNNSESDVDECEEWERHEALDDDPTNVERNKERLFEEEIELKWEKGGSGLVFYTDAQYWKEQEGDFDEQTTDDWDVDMSVYYEENGGDKDARDYITIRQEQRRRNGEEDTDLRTAGFMRNKKDRKSKITVESHNKIGAFELFTKGIGRKVLEKQGWQEGEGVGFSAKGISDALDNEGQSAADKRGLGYHGEKLDRGNVYGPSSLKIRKVQKDDKPVTISTVYDDPKVTDPQEQLLRRNHHHHIKYRHGINFQKAADSD